ncbi:hypothetical protein O8C97_02295, partial [Aliarcobacter butzleri]|uniref:hypothetical protein n=1 Tax=Aliarcobacter butzleri TaxID=28197 RepID=UPI00263DD4B9
LFIADNTAGSPCGNVGHRQLFKFLFKAFPKLVLPTTFGEAFFLALPPPFIFFTQYLIFTLLKSSFSKLSSAKLYF